MPRVIEVDGYDVRVYTRDEHPPAHVHVEKAGTNMKFMLGDDGVEYHSYKQRPPTNQEIRRAAEIVAEHFADCLATWKANIK